MAARMVRMCGGGGEPAAVRKGPWTLEEDLILVSYISEHGEGSWDNLARAAGLNRNGKSCRLRWLNYLRPGVRRGSITPAEDAVIRELQATLGNKWSKIAKHLPGRTDNEIKNYWRTRIQKRPPSTTTTAQQEQEQQQQTRRQPAMTPTTVVSEDASSSSAARQDDDTAGDCWFTQLKAEPRVYYCQLDDAAVVPAATDAAVKSDRASSSALMTTSQDDSWYTQAGYYSSGLSSAAADAQQLGTAGVDASSATTQFFPSSDQFTDSFWSAVNSFWETIPVKGTF